MIETHEIPDGLLLSVEPFSKPNRNAGCRIIAEIRSSKGKGRVVRFRVCELRNMMTLADMAILMTAMRALMDAVNQQTLKAKPSRKGK